MFLLLPFDSLVVNLLGISLTVLFTLLLVFIIVPAIFGVSFGIRLLYMKTLLQIFQVSWMAWAVPCAGICWQQEWNSRWVHPERAFAAGLVSAFSRILGPHPQAWHLQIGISAVAEPTARKPQTTWT